MLSIGQFLDEDMKEGDCMPWLLAYTCALQHMGEATEERTWYPIGMHFTLQVSLFVDTFIEEMGAELTELGITSCWGQPFPAPLTEPSMPHRSNHLGYILGCMVDLGGALPPLRFCVTEPSGEYVGVACSLLFEGNILMYDPAFNGMEWIPVQGTANSLSPMEDSSAQELSNITLLNSPEDIPQMDQFGERHWGPASVSPAVASHARAAPHDKEEVME